MLLVGGHNVIDVDHILEVEGAEWVLQGILGYPSASGSETRSISGSKVDKAVLF